MSSNSADKSPLKITTPVVGFRHSVRKLRVINRGEVFEESFLFLAEDGGFSRQLGRNLGMRLSRFEFHKIPGIS
jgi:hypothetical protein